MRNQTERQWTGGAGFWVFSIVLFCFGASARAQSPSLADVFKKVNPAVVEIHTRETYRSAEFADGTVRMSALGSGVLISGEGTVLTAAHLVQTADVIEVEFVTGERVPADVVSSEPEIDLACLKLERMPHATSVALLADSDRVEVGAPVFVIGAPLGLSHTLTAGHISGHHLLAVPGDSMGAEFFQTDAALNEGNSGGPMFNMDGEVIGIVSRIVSLSGGSDGLGFAVTSNVARRLLAEKSIWTGVGGQILSGDLARVFNIPPPGVGLLVQRVAIGSPAQRAGLRGGIRLARIGDQELLVGGDIVLSVMGISVDRPDYISAMREQLSLARPGQTVEIVALRGGSVVTLTVPAPR